MSVAEKLSYEPGILSRKDERKLLFILAVIQFTHITDFVILMPLGPQLIRGLQITPSDFSLLVSAYTFSAAVFSLFAALFLDRWDRKKALLTVYAGFAIGTTWCGFAHRFEELLVARAVAGAFGGTVSTLSFAIVGDLIPASRRGRAMGLLMSSFSVATVFGLPLGLALAALWDWNAVFLSIGVAALPLLAFASFTVPSVRGHLDSPPPASKLVELFRNFQEPQAVWGLVLGAGVVTAGFLVIPFLSPSLVANVGIKESALSLVYLAGGVCTFFTSQLIGRACDRWGHARVFRWVATASILPILLMTNLSVVPLWVAISCSSLFMILVSGRMVPTLAIVSSLVPASRRGGYMSLVSFFQQLAMGASSLIAGRIIVTGEGGRLLHYGRSGFLSVAVTLGLLWIVRRLPAAQRDQ